MKLCPLGPEGVQAQQEGMLSRQACPQLLLPPAPVLLLARNSATAVGTGRPDSSTAPPAMTQRRGEQTCASDN